MLCKNPVLKEKSDRRPVRMLLSSGAIFTVKNPCENSGTTEAATSPVIPHFPHPPNFRGHNSEKTRNRAGIIQRFPTGTDAVEYSRVTETERRMGCGLGGTRHRRRGIFPASSRVASWIKRNSLELFFCCLLLFY